MHIPRFLVKPLARAARRHLAKPPWRCPNQFVRGEEDGVLLIKRFNLFPWLERHFGIAVRLHAIVGSDKRIFHDHPWWNVTLVLDGCYYEVMPDPACGNIALRRETGDVVFRAAAWRHRIVLQSYDPYRALTLFIHGRKTRQWGFWRGERFTPAKHQ
jgi:hypothetical protein